MRLQIDGLDGHDGLTRISFWRGSDGGFVLICQYEAAAHKVGLWIREYEAEFPYVPDLYKAAQYLAFTEDVAAHNQRDMLPR
jgi:hypothetical protein